MDGLSERVRADRAVVDDDGLPRQKKRAVIARLFQHFCTMAESRKGLI
jgi:hypothetical protein